MALRRAVLYMSLTMLATQVSATTKDFVFDDFWNVSSQLYPVDPNYSVTPGSKYRPTAPRNSTIWVLVCLQAQRFL